MNYLFIGLAIYAVLNIIAFLVFVWDKHKAMNDQWRTRESTLLFLALLGPFGATAGMLAVRHKTQKIKFKLVYIFLAVHIIAIVCLFATGVIKF
ncbi:MAG: DUF1294 domain-containing protein [Thermoplasmata archaeon]|jgi:uncharacterized membrane protein YsdA (DUF1294 family)|nr:DUF1294 domain-containing protein [Thermoplasmata archaeon]